MAAYSCNLDSGTVQQTAAQCGSAQTAWVLCAMALNSSQQRRLNRTNSDYPGTIFSSTNVLLDFVEALDPDDVRHWTPVQQRDAVGFIRHCIHVMCADPMAVIPGHPGGPHIVYTSPRVLFRSRTRFASWASLTHTTVRWLLLLFARMLRCDVGACFSAILRMASSLSLKTPSFLRAFAKLGPPPMLQCA